MAAQAWDHRATGMTHAGGGGKLGEILDAVGSPQALGAAATGLGERTIGGGVLSGSAGACIAIVGRCRKSAGLPTASASGAGGNNRRENGTGDPAAAIETPPATAARDR